MEKCPRCNQVKELDALSRKDNQTKICSTCGVEEAMEDYLGRGER